MLNLYLMRHGDAAPGFGGPDYMRALTPLGVKQARAQGEMLQSAQPKVDSIFHSPYKRAIQTADEVNDFLNLQMSSCDHLVPGGSVSGVLDTIAGIEQHLLLVCHLPIIAEIAQAITGRDLAFYPATVALIERKDAFANKGELKSLWHA